MDLLLINKRPRLALLKPAIMRRSVLLPQPDAPTMQMNSPSSTRKSMPSNASTCSPDAVL
jgi:hypothetical protein